MGTWWYGATNTSQIFHLESIPPHINEYNDTWGQSGLSTWEDYVVGTYIATVVCISVIVNALVLIVMYRHRLSLIYSDYFIISLAFTDLGSPVFAYPLACFSSYGHRWLYGRLGCQINGFLGFYFGICGMQTLAVMSLARYIKICHRKYASKLNNSTTLYLIFTIYFSCALIAVCPFFYWGQYDLEIFGTSCSIVWRKQDISYITFIMVTCLALPCLTMCVSYVGIVRQTRCYASNIRTRRNWTKNEMSLVKTTFCMCIAFVSAWTPYAVVSVISSIYEEEVITKEISIVPHLVAKSSHLLNPIVYFYMNNKYKQYVLNMIRLFCRCASEQPEETRMTSGGGTGNQSSEKQYSTCMPGNDNNICMEKIEYSCNVMEDSDDKRNESSYVEKPLISYQFQKSDKNLLQS